MVSVNAVDVALAATPGFIDMGKTIANAFTAKQQAAAQQAQLAFKAAQGEAKAAEQRRQFEAREARIAREAQKGRDLRRELAGGKTPSLGAGFKPPMVDTEDGAKVLAPAPQVNKAEMLHRFQGALKLATTEAQRSQIIDAMEKLQLDMELTASDLQLAGITPRAAPPSFGEAAAARARQRAMDPPDVAGVGDAAVAGIGTAGAVAGGAAAAPGAAMGAGAAVAPPALTTPGQQQQQPALTPAMAEVQGRLQRLAEQGQLAQSDLPMVPEVVAAVGNREQAVAITQQAAQAALHLGRINAVIDRVLQEPRRVGERRAAQRQDAFLAGMSPERRERLRDIGIEEGGVPAPPAAPRLALPPETDQEKLARVMNDPRVAKLMQGRILGPDLRVEPTPAEREAIRKAQLLQAALPPGE